MVISSTSAVEDSIQAVSPELILAPSTSSGFVGAGGAAGAAAGAPAAGAAAGAAAAGAGAAGEAAGAAGLSWAMTGAHQPTAPNRARIAKSFFIVVLPQSASDRKSTRLNSSHSQISYAVFCFKKKKKHVIEY